MICGLIPAAALELVDPSSCVYVIAGVGIKSALPPLITSMTDTTDSVVERTEGDFIDLLSAHGDLAEYYLYLSTQTQV
jgi:hypothetical protein